MQKFEIRCLISGKQTGNAVSVFEEVVAPSAGPPMHTHRDQMEIFHVMSGEFEFTVGGQVIQAQQGDTAVVPAEVPHRFQNVGQGEGVLHFELLPSGTSEAFFSRLVNDTPAIEELPAFFDEHGLDLV